MNILSIDTSTDALSVALGSGDDVLVDHQIAPQQHATLLLPIVDKLLGDAGLGMTDLDGIVYGRGPGSFTGVRIASAVAQGLAMGADIGVFGVSSLLATAQACHEQTGADRVIAVFDARMQEVYWGLYQQEDNALMQLMGEERVCAASDVPMDSSIEVITGAGAERYRDILDTKATSAKLVFRSDRWPMAVDLLALAEPRFHAGNTTAPEDAMPVYLRNKVALTEAERSASAAR